MSASAGPIQPVARNLRRVRLRRSLSLTAVADAAGVSKSTLSELERGMGNPSIDTLWTLARTLGIPFAELFEDAANDGISVRRLDEAPVVSSDDGFRALHLLTRSGRGATELYLLELEPGAERVAESHLPGLVEHVVVLRGTLEAGPVDAFERLSVGDYVRFPADVPHLYRAPSGRVRALALHDYP